MDDPMADIEIDLQCSEHVELRIDWHPPGWQGGTGIVKLREPTLEQSERWSKSFVTSHEVYLELVVSEEGLPTEPYLRRHFEREALTLLFQYLTPKGIVTTYTENAPTTLTLEGLLDIKRQFDDTAYGFSLPNLNRRLDFRDYRLEEVGERYYLIRVRPEILDHEKFPTVQPAPKFIGLEGMTPEMAEQLTSMFPFLKTDR